jgi:hypothetical protein
LVTAGLGNVGLPVVTTGLAILEEDEVFDEIDEALTGVVTPEDLALPCTLVFESVTAGLVTVLFDIIFGVFGVEIFLLFVILEVAVDETEEEFIVDEATFIAPETEVFVGVVTTEALLILLGVLASCLITVLLLLLLFTLLTLNNELGCDDVFISTDEAGEATEDEICVLLI